MGTRIFIEERTYLAILKFKYIILLYVLTERDDEPTDSVSRVRGSEFIR